MSNIFYKFPKELQDHIYSYNVLHRKMMKAVCDELLFLHQEIECDNQCGGYDTRNNLIVNNILFNDYYFCSEWCSNDFECELRRSYRHHIYNIKK